MAEPRSRRVRIRVRGRVQGVWFRAETEAFARGIGIAGWVRNAEDGSVEVVAEGTAEALERLAAWCREGPADARVDSLELDWEAPRGERGFHVAG